jgi:hypothetical protein
MTLKEFLAAASEDHATALSEAHAHTEVSAKLYTANVMTVVLVSAGVYGVLSDTAQDAASPVRDICLALMDRLRSEGEFNLAPSHPMGQANIQMLDGMIAGLPDYAAQLTGLKAQLIAGAEVVNHPFAGVTLYDVLKARGVCPRVSVAPNAQGWVVVTASADCPRHSPQILAVNPRTGREERVGVLSGVETAGGYECRIGHEQRGWPLVLENAYGVFG